MTTKKYLRVAFIDGVGLDAEAADRCAHLGAVPRRIAALQPSIAAMPASSRMMLTIDHIAAEVLIVLPTSGSCGQLLVYESPALAGGRSRRPGDQKKKRGERLALGLLGRAPSVIAYCSRSLASVGSVPNRPS
jgi:hypothetical protein